VVGPAIGGVLLGAFGAAWCFLIDALSYLVVLGSTLFIRMPARLAARRGGSAQAHLAEGARYVWRHASLRPAMAMLAGMSLFGWAYLSQMAAMAKLALGLGPRGFGFLLAANGLGAVAGALRVATLGDRGGLPRQMRNGVFIFCAGLVSASLPADPWAAAAGFVVAGFGLVTFFASCNSYVQTHTDDAYRGRVMGLYALVFGGGMPLGSLWLGLAAEHWGVRTALRLAAAFSLVAAFAGLAWGRQARRGRR
jgi:predicted MFS family arabinose efflux permease